MTTNDDDSKFLSSLSLLLQELQRAATEWLQSDETGPLHHRTGQYGGGLLQRKETRGFPQLLLLFLGGVDTQEEEVHLPGLRAPSLLIQQ